MIVPYYFCIVFKSVKAIYIYASVRSRYALSENGIAQYALTYCFGDIEGLTLTNFVKLMLSQHIFWYLIAYISWMVAQTPVNHIIFWKSVMIIFRCIYISYFNRLRFLAENSTKLKKMNFSWQFKDHKLPRKHGS